MAAGTHTYTIEQGSTFRRQLTYQGTDGTVIDLTGYTARMDIKEKITDATPVISLTDGNGGIVLGGAAGTIDLYISDVDTDAMTFDLGVYDLEIRDSAGTGDVTRLIEGNIKISKSVTR